MSSPVLEVLPMGTQWVTLDPFLFCAHHLDFYPTANDSLGPDASLQGREIGSDFANIDGWNMYHGSQIPGFPQHPHRGFETITYLKQGWCDHSDSLGFKARFGKGDAQWLTAGSGILHSEMFPLLNTNSSNDLHLFQIWLNLPAANKMVDPYFSMLWQDKIPKLETPGVSVNVITGDFGELKAESAPPDSWAANPENKVAIWHIELEADADFESPTATDVNRVLYIFDGELEIAGNKYQDNGLVIDASEPLKLKTSSGAKLMLLQGRPIGEPVAQYGPFVMNNEAELKETVREYNKTSFGGWPWPKNDPTHGPDLERFADNK